jgi:chromosome partitioning protein
MAHVVAVSNQKGGVGKTTTVVNLAAYCALGGFKTLVIDNDPQGNASSVLAAEAAAASVYGGTQPKATRQEGLWVVPAAHDLIDQEKILVRSDKGRFALRDIIAPWRAEFDLILIDCPPNLSQLPTNALLASDHLLVPLQSEYFALEGLTQLLAYVEDLRHEVSASIQLLGVLLTMYDGRHPLALQVEAEIRQHFVGKAFQTIIPRDIALAAAPSHGKTILDYDPLSPGGLSYLSAAKELIYGFKRQ